MLFSSAGGYKVIYALENNGAKLINNMERGYMGEILVVGALMYNCAITFNGNNAISFLSYYNQLILYPLIRGIVIVQFNYETSRDSTVS